ncbi:hypothetical protein HCA55_06370 [Listeria booriae]|uniref:YqgU-like 6-bladed beta-propeller domain-containing protein n=1 Tax=Listeria booriae TaxID=1552123 RepID=A0A7X0YR37_9LIST|nr:hypothetical protein [Listeria booriae]MBC1557914.1 hypothetical protein [Listeria booriae]MBC1796341.1 hypothetical protein [Listeria booriae]MBC1812592.1 hypothetical protein [Listeria booriae]MBC1974668.1 hypothetical protein [Listeria booriae]MBC2031960.1 hypothetical protein [Listeria booriae]
MNKKRIFFLITILGLLFLSYGCESEKAPTKKQTSTPDTIKTSNIKAKEFQRVVGWIDDNHVLVQLKGNKKMTFESLNVFTNKRKPIYETKNVISEVLISPNRDRFLLYSAANKNEASLEVISMSGALMYTKSVKPQNIEFGWNQDNQDKMFLTTFDTDWNYQVFQWDILSGALTKLNTDAPFVTWYSDNLFVFNQKTSPKDDKGDLYLEDMRDKQMKSLIAADIYQFVVSANTLLTMEPSDTEKEMTYNFRTIGFQSYYSYDAPRVYDELGTFFPFYDLNVEQQSFLTFEPYESKKLKDYGGEFKLVSVDPKAKKKTTVLELVNNEPILTSPNGRYCLYGYLFDQIIDLKTENITYLIQHQDKMY